MDREKIIYSIERCISHVPDACRDCAYDAGHPYNECVEVMLKDVLAILKEQDELINELLELGYPHNFQHEAPWVVDYLYSLTEIIKKAFKIKEGR